MKNSNHQQSQIENIKNDILKEINSNMEKSITENLKKELYDKFYEKMKNDFIKDFNNNVYNKLKTHLENFVKEEIEKNIPKSKNTINLNSIENNNTNKIELKKVPKVNEEKTKLETLEQNKIKENKTKEINNTSKKISNPISNKEKEKKDIEKSKLLLNNLKKYETFLKLKSLDNLPKASFVQMSVKNESIHNVTGDSFLNENKNTKLDLTSNFEKDIVNEIEKLPYENIVLFSNLTLENEIGIAKINKLLITEIGVILINYIDKTGVITGTRESFAWKEINNGKEERFPNPVHDILISVKVLEKICNLKNQFFIPIVLFHSKKTRKIPKLNLVSFENNLQHLLAPYNNKNILTKKQIEDIFYKINVHNEKSKENKKSKEKILVKMPKEDFDKIQEKICPKCGSNLILKKENNNIYISCENTENCDFKCDYEALDYYTNNND